MLLSELLHYEGFTVSEQDGRLRLSFDVDYDRTFSCSILSPEYQYSELSCAMDVLSHFRVKADRSFGDARGDGFLEMEDQVLDEQLCRMWHDLAHHQAERLGHEVSALRGMPRKKARSWMDDVSELEERFRLGEIGEDEIEVLLEGIAKTDYAALQREESRHQPQELRYFIDRMMRPLIWELNSAGFRTRSCCAGEQGSDRRKGRAAFVEFEHPAFTSLIRRLIRRMGRKGILLDHLQVVGNMLIERPDSLCSAERDLGMVHRQLRWLTHYFGKQSQSLKEMVAGYRRRYGCLQKRFASGKPSVSPGLLIRLSDNSGLCMQFPVHGFRDLRDKVQGAFDAWQQMPEDSRNTPVRHAIQYYCDRPQEVQSRRYRFPWPVQIVVQAKDGQGWRNPWHDSRQVYLKPKVRDGSLPAEKSENRYVLNLMRMESGTPMNDVKWLELWRGLRIASCSIQ